MKKKKYSVGSTALSTIGSAVIAMILSSLITLSIGSVVTSTPVLVIIQIVAVFIFLGMIYGPSWYCGDHDVNAVQFGRMEEDPLKGLKIGLIAAIPYALTIILLIISKLDLLYITIDGQRGPLDLGFAYRILNIQYLYMINALIDPEAGTAAASWLSIFGVWLYNLLIPLVCTAGYALGYRHISIMERLVFKNLPKNQKKPR